MIILVFCGILLLSGYCFHEKQRSVSYALFMLAGLLIFMITIAIIQGHLIRSHAIAPPTTSHAP